MMSGSEGRPASGRLRRLLLAPRFSLVEVAGVAFVLVGLLLGGVWYWVARYTARLDPAALGTPLPAVRAAAEGPRLGREAYRGDYDFTSDWFTPNIPVWREVLAPYAGKPGVRYLEVGLFEGRSALWVLENVLTDPTSRLVGVDPFLGDYQGRYRRNVERSGAAGRVRTIKGYSQVVLRTVPLESFDIVYIDGSHATADVLEDAVLSWRLLKPGGALIFDDYRWDASTSECPTDSPDDSPKRAIDCFVGCFARRLRVIHNSYQLIVRKEG
jgi:SAM-dependent methyltransferase